MEAKELYTKVERDYKKLSKKLAEHGSTAVRQTAEEFASYVASSDKRLLTDLRRTYQFIIGKFDGQFRKDGKTPMVAHSMYLPVMLRHFGETLPDTFLTAMLHDVVEDTKTSWEELENLEYKTPRHHPASYIRFMTEDKNLPKAGEEHQLSRRVTSFIQQLRKAPGIVISTEIVDRLNDLSDLEYLSSMPREKWEKKILKKVSKCKNIIFQIIEGRKDYNSTALEVFKYRVSQLEEELGQEVPILKKTGQ